MSQKIDPIAFVIEKIKELLQINNGIKHIKTFEPDTHTFTIIKGTEKFKVEISNENIEDFEGSSESVNSKQFIDLMNHIEFKIYTQLLKQNALPNSFRISEKIIDEKRNWATYVEHRISFDDNVQEYLYKGLMKSKKYLETKKRTLNLESIKKELLNVKFLLGLYDKEKTFSSNEGSSEWLSFLKAALVSEIIDLEEKRKGTSNRDYLREINNSINSLVDTLRDIHKGFFNIELPNFIRDYASDVKTNNFNPLSSEEDIVPFASNKVIFLARKFNEPESDKMKQIIESEFAKEGFTIQEGEVKDCGYVSEDILNKIKTSGFFIALITPVNELKSGKFSTSTCVLMETGAAVAFGRKVIPMVDESVDSSEYRGKLQRDCQDEQFSKDNFSDILRKVVDRIKKEYEKNV